MIKPYPNPIVKKDPSIPSKEKLEIMLTLNGMSDIVKQEIKKYGLPYDVVEKEGKYVLIDTLSEGELWLNKFITEDEGMLQMKEDATLIMKSPYEVLITGETGTGKELIAYSMIYNRKGGIRAVNCAGFPESLMESELFGYIKGSFTGADRDKIGLMQAAQDGVMFLDEIGELPLHLQPKLLRAIESKKIRPVGSNNEVDINCKFVCATNRNIIKMVEDGKFMKDLYARISTLTLHITPLVERKCDYEPIALSMKGGKEFLDKYRTELMNGDLDVSLNVRSLRQHIIRYQVLGRLIKIGE